MAMRDMRRASATLLIYPGGIISRAAAHHRSERMMAGAMRVDYY